MVSCFINQLKKETKSYIRWTKPENLHVTLQFLPEIKSVAIANLVDNVKKEIPRSLSPISFEMQRIKLFPSFYHPRVVVLEVTQQAELALLATRIGQVMKALHYPIETRPFCGHLTLGRIKHPQQINFNFLKNVNVPKFSILSTDIVLFQSEPEVNGSKYTVLERITI